MKKKELQQVVFKKVVDARYEIQAKKCKDGIVVAFYEMHELVLRTWLGKKEFLNIVEETGKRSLKTVDEILYSINFSKELVIKDRSRKTLQKFFECNEEEASALYAQIVRHEINIKKEISIIKEAEKLKISTEKIKLVSKEPKHFDEWLEKRNVKFVLENFRFSKKDQTQTKAFCSYCGHEWMTVSKHGDYGECPHCKAHGSYTKDNIRSIKHANYDGIYLAKTKEGEIVEVVKHCFVTYDRSYRKRSVRISYGDRRIIPYNGTFYTKYGNGWKESKGTFNRYGSIYNYYSQYCYLYPDNVKRLLKGTKFEYLEVEKYARAMKNELGFFNAYVTVFERYPIVEQVMKAGYRDMIYKMITYNMYSLVDNYIQGYLKKSKPKNESLAKAMGLTKTQFDAFKNSPDQLYEVPVAAYANLVSPDTPIEVVKVYANILKNVKTYYSYNGIGPAIRNKDMLTVPFARYLVSQNADAAFIKDYNDYYLWLKELDYKLTKSRLRPKDFKKEHDRISDEINKFKEAKKQELLQKESVYMGEIKQLVEELFKIPLSDDDYEIVVPGCREDLINESKILNHCVRNYSSNIYNHSCVIVFIRKKSEISKPFYTMEINNGFGITQCRTQSNQSYEKNETMNKIVKSFAAEIKKRAKMEEFKPIIEKLQFKQAA